ncbi:MAG TPA: DHHA1 domain-containing protein, partial [Solirubrobacterales bacterium]
TAAETARRQLPEHLREGLALVLAGEDWHPGVIGIVASRLVERHHRPVVVVSLDGEGSGRGSGRSIPGFDLLAALEACSEHLESFGGHRAAAGLSLRAESLDAFREAFAAHAAIVLRPEDLRPTQRIDAMVGGVGLGLDLAEELGQLAPFGMGNPGVRLMVPSARVSDVRTMGKEGKHARFSLHSGAHRALGVAFGRSSLGVEDDDPVDAAVRLEVNHWNGSVEPRVVLNELYPLDGGEADGAGARLHTCECTDEEWWPRFEAELSRDLGAGPTRDGAALSTEGPQERPEERSRTVVHGSGPATVTIAELVSSGAGVLAVCADASRRAALAGGATGLARFNGGSARIACSRCGAAALDGVLTRGEGGLALTDYATLERQPGGVAERFEHVVLVDPPLSKPAALRAGVPRVRADEEGREEGSGYLHLLWTDAEREFSRAVAAEQLASRETVAAVFRRLREAGEVSGKALREALAGAGPHPLSAEVAARCFRVLAELGLVAGEPSGGAGVVGVVSSEGTDLQRSAAFRAYRADHSEAQPYLERPKQP